MERRKRRYFMLMAICLTLFVASWTVVPLWSRRAAVVVAIVAMVIPPIAVIVANAGWFPGRGDDNRQVRRPRGDVDDGHDASRARRDPRRGA